jgi:hypothetical protein
MSDFQELETNPTHFDAIANAADRLAKLTREAAQHSRDGEYRSAIGAIAAAQHEADNMQKAVDGLLAIHRLAG